VKIVKVEALKKMGFKRVELSELPNEFIATVEGEESRIDKRGKEAYFLTLKLEDGSTLRQKYTSIHLSDLGEALEKLGIEDTKKMIGKKYKFVKKNFGIGNARWILVEEVQ
jgi:hypothetical protein